MLRYVAMFCSVLKCVEVCCSVLQCGTVPIFGATVTVSSASLPLTKYVCDMTVCDMTHIYITHMCDMTHPYV